MSEEDYRERHEGLSQAFQKMDSEIAGGVLRDNLRNSKEEEGTNKPLSFHATNPRQEGYLHHFLNRLAKLCSLRGDLIPKAQESLLKQFFLNRRDRHHLQQMSYAHALRSEAALNHGNAKLALTERLEAWRKMPRDLSLLLDVAEAYIEPQSFVETSDWETETGENQREPETISEEIEHSEAASDGKNTPAPNKQRWNFWSVLRKKANQKAKKRQEKRLLHKQGKQQHKQKKQKAKQLFQLSTLQHQRLAIKYLKKAVELSVGLELEAKNPDAREGLQEVLADARQRLGTLQQSYPNVNWEHFTERVRAFKGSPPKRWPWVLLILLLLGAVYAAIIYLPWRSWWTMLQTTSSTPLQKTVSQPNESILLKTPVPVEWSVPSENDLTFDKSIQKSQRFKLNQHYVYEVQGHIRVSYTKFPKPPEPDDDEEALATKPMLQPSQPFDLLLIYQHRGQEIKKWQKFSYDNRADPNEVDRAPIMEGDTVLFREVFRLARGPTNEDRLVARIITVGKAPDSAIPDIQQNGLIQKLPSVDLQGNLVPTVDMAFRNRVRRKDGENLRLLGYDIELQNNSREPIEHYELRLSLREEDGVYTKENSPLLLEREYTLVSNSGTNLPGLARMTRRLWLEIPEGLSYPVEKLTPQVRILNSRFASQ